MTPDERRLRKAVTKTILGLLVFAIVIFLLSTLFGFTKPPKKSKRPKHYKTTQARYNPYDKNGLLKSSTPLYLDKNKGRKTRYTHRCGNPESEKHLQQVTKQTLVCDNWEIN